MNKTTGKSKKELRKFGLVMTIPLAIIGGLMLWKGRAAAPYFLALAGFFLVSGLAVPVILLPIEKAWMALARTLSIVMTTVILTLTYFLVITPVGLIFRVLGKDPLALKFDRNLSSYWIAVDPEGPTSRADRPY